MAADTRGRRCGGCTLCCKLVPVASLGKRAGERCAHQRSGKGCAIYPSRPAECRGWSCLWLADPATAGLRRPDGAHYVIDPLLDTARIVPHDGSPARDVEAVQVWCDPAFPDAWQDPALLAWMDSAARRDGTPTIIRWANVATSLVMPPCLNPDAGGKWSRTPPAAPSTEHGIGRYARLPEAERPPL